MKERLLTRAEIIQRRLDEEQKNLETAYVSNFHQVYDACKLFSKNLRGVVRHSDRMIRMTTRRRSPKPTSGWTFLPSVLASTTKTRCRSSRIWIRCLWKTRDLQCSTRKPHEVLTVGEFDKFYILYYLESISTQYITDCAHGVLGFWGFGVLDGS